MTGAEAARDWLLTSTPAGPWVAIRREPLDPCHLQYGCRAVVYADTLADLELQLTLEAMMRGYAEEGTP